MKKRIVIALGGNALGETPKEQLEIVKSTAKRIVDLIEIGNSVVIGHGNGPQVGVINGGMEFAYNNGEKTPYFPFPECGAMSQGYIGYHLQQAIINELKKRKINKNCLTIITQVEVNSKDEAFLNPTKPIGIFYTKEQALELEKQTGYQFMEDAGRGYRRVVPSPKPIKIVELESINQLIDNDNIVITIGGGGIPVVTDNDNYEGIDAVIDKDKSSARLASDLEADILLILTGVPQVYLNFGKPNAEALKEITVAEAKQYISLDYFAKGSMLPKIEACLEYILNNPKGEAIITSLDKVQEALEGKTGTRIINK